MAHSADLEGVKHCICFRCDGYTLTACLNGKDER